jgi:hypothetical protein
MKMLFVLVLLGLAVFPAFADDDTVMAADRAFAQLAAEKGTAYAFWFYSAETVRLYGEHGGPSIGKAAAAPKFDNSGPQLKWAPIAGAQSADGTVGWTDGSWTLIGKDSTDTGHYVTVWVKEGGVWRVQADIGTTDIRAAITPKP